MAVPGSGELSLTKIYSEVNVDDYNDNNSDGDVNLSLQELSIGDISNINRGNLPANRPDEAAPHSMSEFYGYDNDATEPSYFDTIADFTITGASGFGAAAVYSSTFVTRISNGLGSFFGTITQTLPANSGTLSIAIGDADPTSTGLGGNAGGFTAAGSVTGGLSISGSQRVFTIFKFQPGMFAVNQVCNVRFSINPISASSLLTGVLDSLSVTVKAT